MRTYSRDAWESKCKRQAAAKASEHMLHMVLTHALNIRGLAL